MGKERKTLDRIKKEREENFKGIKREEETNFSTLFNFFSNIIDIHS
jgi:hypothetical protein